MPSHPSARLAVHRVHEVALSRLFERHRRLGDLNAREELIQHFRPLAAGLARRYHSPDGEPFEDLLQVALVGLVKAVDRFDPAYGTRFVSFAEPTILGELRRYFRDGTWSVHLPRGVKEDVLAVEHASEALFGELGRSPTVVEIAERARLDVGAVLDALEAGRTARTRPLDEPAGDGDARTLGDRHGATEPGYELVEYGVSVREAVGELSERDRLVLHLRFVEDLTQSRIAARVGISQMQVSRVLTQALRRLREAAGEDG